jgi:hypothetical protein
VIFDAKWRATRREAKAEREIAREQKRLRYAAELPMLSKRICVCGHARWEHQGWPIPAFVGPGWSSCRHLDRCAAFVWDGKEPTP